MRQNYRLRKNGAVELNTRTQSGPATGDRGGDNRLLVAPRTDPDGKFPIRLRDLTLAVQARKSIALRALCCKQPTQNVRL